MEPAQARDKGARFLLVAASLVVVVAGLKAAAGLALPFLIAIFLSTLSLPLLNWLQRQKIPMPLAVVLTIVALFAAVALLVVLVGESLSAFTAEVPRYQARFKLMVADAVDWLEGHGINASEELTSTLLDPEQAFGMVTGTLKGVAAVLSNMFLVLLTIVFILFECAGFPAKFREAFGEPRHAGRIRTIQTEVQHFLAIKTLVSVITGALVAGSMSVIGVDFPVLWGVTAFLMNYIPALGSILAAIPPVALALIQLDVGHAVAVALVFVTINIVLGNFIEPYLMGRGLGLSTLVVFVSLVFWGWVWGPVGMLVSVPLTMIMKIMLENTEDLRWVAVLLGSAPKKKAVRSRSP